MAQKARIVTPADQAAAEKMLSRLVEVELRIQEVELDRDREVHAAIAAAQAKATKVATPLMEEYAGLFDALKRYANDNRDELTEEGKRKSVSWTSGVFGWVNSAPKISTEGKKDIIADRILALAEKAPDLKRFLREKYELNIEAMEADHEAASAIEGISYSPGGRESFFLRFNLPGAETLKTAARKLRKVSDRPPEAKQAA